MKNKYKYLLATFLAVIILAVPLLAVNAQLEMDEGLEDIQLETGLSDEDLTVVIGRILRIVLSFLGLIALIIIVAGGFLWMTSGGEEEKVSKAKKMMINGLIGLIIIVLAYAIANFIISALITATEV